MAGDKTNLYHRRSIRLKGYDYSQPGAYFITVCTQNHECLLGKIVKTEMLINAWGDVVQECWYDLPNHYAGLELDISVVMPNHVHGIIVLADSRRRAGLKPAPTPGLPEIVRAFKTFSARRINRIRSTAGAPFWQRGYYEHVIRNENELNRVREYIMQNPSRWSLDRENYERKGKDEIEDWLYLGA
ncbi:MAG TPA: transposase [archaeon]|nr:transposase [archaeon]